MGALRKAGVWLGLVEDDDDHDYDDAPAETYTRHRSTPICAISAGALSSRLWHWQATYNPLPSAHVR